MLKHHFTRKKKIQTQQYNTGRQTLYHSMFLDNPILLRDV